MAKKTKKQVKAQREKSKRKKIAKMEKQDSLGIKREKKRFTISLKCLYIMKIIGIVLIPVVYFIYSPLLILVVLYYISLFYFSIQAQRGINNSYLKAKNISIPKFDSAIALLVLIISFFGASSDMGGKFGRFSNTFSSKLLKALKSFGSLHTGQRRSFGPNKGFDFSTMKPPANFVPSGERPPMPPKDFSMDNIPLEFMFSQIFSTVMTVLVMLISVFGIISLVVTYKKIQKMNKEEKEVLTDKGFFLSDEKISQILSFEGNPDSNEFIVNEESNPIEVEDDSKIID